MEDGITIRLLLLKRKLNKIKEKTDTNRKGDVNMIYMLTATYERDGKNNHVRRKYFVHAADKTETEEKVLRSKAIRNKIFY